MCAEIVESSIHAFRGCSQDAVLKLEIHSSEGFILIITELVEALFPTRSSPDASGANYLIAEDSEVLPESSSPSSPERSP